MSKTQKFSRYRLWCSGHGRQQIQETSQHFLKGLPQVNVEESSISESETQNEQLSFLSVLGLVTQERGEILKKKSQERKKRSCASPHFLHRLLKAEKQDLDGNDPKEGKPRKRRSEPREEVIKKKKEIKEEDKEMNDQTASTVAEEDQEVLNDFHYELCHKCNDSGELLLCDTCPFSFHLHCVQLIAVPEGTWFCPLCEEKAASIKIPTFDESEIVKIYEKLLDDKEKLLDDAFKIRTEHDAIEKKLQQMQVAIQDKEDEELSKKKEVDISEKLLKDIDLFFMP